MKRASTWHADETYDAPSAAPGYPARGRGAGGERRHDLRQYVRRLRDAVAGNEGKARDPHRPPRLYQRPGFVKLYGEDYVRERNKDRPEQLHPAVRQHPITGRNVLFVNPTHCHGFVGMDDGEAIPLIEELRDHATQDRFTYYHSWRVGDVVIWDEIATMHRGAGDADPRERRIMLRTIVHPN